MGNLKKGSLTVLLIVMSLSLLITPYSNVSADTGGNSNATNQQAASGSGTGSGNYEKVTENSSLAMYMDKSTGVFYVQNKSTGEIWNSSESGSSDPKYNSELYAEYMDKSGSTYPLNSKSESIKTKGLSVKSVTGGVEATYTFTKEGFVFPVVYKLLDDGLEVSIKADEIKENNKDKYTLSSFSILPLFGAGDANSKGYMFVPDGSGAVINYNNGKSGYGDYKQYIYGRDTSIAVDEQQTNSENASLPVFGVKNGDSAMLGIIDSGESRAIVNAEVIGDGNAYNTVYPEFIYRDYTTTAFKGKSWDKKKMVVAENNPVSIDQYSVRYCFLPKDQANYTGMALRYQKYLQDDKGVTSTVTDGTYPLYVNLFGSVRKMDSFLGFPINKDIPLTTFADAENILSQLKGSGVNDIVLKYNAWLKGGADSSIPVDVNVSSALGGKKELTNLTNYLAASNIPSFFDINLTDMYKSRFGYDQKSDSARELNNMPSMQYQYLLDLYVVNDADNPLYLLKPSKIPTAAAAVAEKLKKLNISGASLDTLGTKLYSSFNKAGNDRVASEKYMTDSIQKIKDSCGKVMFDDPNAYAIPYASYLSSIPLQSSGEAVEDYDVPFYQISLHGLLSYSAPAINQTSDLKLNVLKALETGSSMQFTWIARNTDKIQDTSFNTLYSANYADWIDDAIQSYQDISGVLKRVATAKITAYDILQNGVVKTTYDNGISVIVNTTDAAVTVDGTTVDAMNFQVKE